jgi:hypothetical protein
LLIYLSLYLYTIKEHFYKTTYDQYDKEKSLLELNSKLPWLVIDVTYWTSWSIIQNKEKWYNKYIESEFDSYEVDYIGVYGLIKKIINKTVS